FYPYIYKLAYVKNRLLNKVWVLIAVSLSAQIGTFPLSLFYFSQFPNYFLLTNLYAIPLAFIILYLAIALILFSPIPFIFHGLSWLLNNSLTALNFLTSLTESLPYSTSTALSITAPQLLALSLTIVLVAIYLESKRRLLLFLSLSSLILFFGLNINKHFTTINSNELTVFADRSATLIGYKQANKLILLASNGQIDSITTKHSFALNGYLNFNRIKQSNISVYSFNGVLKNDYQFENLSITQNKLGLFIYAKGKTMLVPNSQNYPYAEKRNKLGVDIVLLNANSPKLDHLLAVVKPATLLVDQTVPYWEIQGISKKALREGLVLHVIDKQGAYSF
ncbi:MAG TPA: ComEC/Rec2 family competence protein, partial [Tenuifilaceae bacterium]|nr:ComEC/Rec2 family competence protein [Tenuifilaceae bacterium]